MKQRINITIEEELLESLREIVKQNDTNISQCVTDMILSSNEMGRYELQKLLERDGHLCSCCGKQFDLKGNRDDALPYVTKVDINGDALLSNKQLICMECRDKKITETFNNIQNYFNELEAKSQLLEDLKCRKQQMDAEIENELCGFGGDSMYGRSTDIDIIWFNGWVQNTCRKAKRGIIPFSDKERLLSIENKPVIYDDENPIEKSYIDGAIMYPIVIDYCVDEQHHDIISTFDDCYGGIDGCGVRAYVAIDDGEDEPYIYVGFKNSTYEYCICDDGDWCMWQ